MKIAGIAGGVGTTVLATVLGAEDCGTDVQEADVVVIRNDYRCLSAFIKRSVPFSVLVVVFMEEGRALDETDVRDVIGHTHIVFVPMSAAIARADDAGMLDEIGHGPVNRLRETVQNAIAYAGK